MKCPRGLLRPGQKVTVITLLSDLEGGSRSEPGEVVKHTRGKVSVKVSSLEVPVVFFACTLCTRIGEMPMRKVTLLPEEAL
jgi:hypothetical protein